MQIRNLFKPAFALAIVLVASGCALVRPPDPVERPRAGDTGADMTPSPVLDTAGFEDGDLFDTLRGAFRLQPFDSAEVRYYENWYRKHPGAISHLASPGRWHLPYVTREVLRRGLPGELALLPAVESGFDATARSPSGAAGLWQFTAVTGDHFGLGRDSWRDERMNIQASTRAALDYLEQLHASFHGDWLLALAAYNAGEGTIRKQMSRARMSGSGGNYRRLRLPTETRHFVPKLIALANVVRNPATFGVTLPKVVDKVRFVRVDTDDRPVDHRQAAAWCGAEMDVIRQLNAGQLQRQVPPNGPYAMNLPSDCAARFDPAKLVDSVRASVDSSSREIVHEVGPGDTLWDLARRYRVSAAAIADWNRIALNGTLNLGQQLMIYVD